MPGAQRRQRPHPPRYRRGCAGELVQIDGCNHEWFEDRGPRSVLLVYVDEPIPLLVDDVLVNLDDRRSRATLPALLDLATKTQLLFFTHHRRHVELATDLGSTEVFVHELSRA